MDSSLPSKLLDRLNNDNLLCQDIVT